MEEKKKHSKIEIIQVFLLSIIVIGLCLLGFGGYFVYDKILSNIAPINFGINEENTEVIDVTETNVIATEENEIDNAIDNTTTPIEEKGTPGEQMIFADAGTVYISTKGEVYFDPAESAKIMGTNWDIVAATKKALGEAGSYEVSSNKFIEGTHTFSYKLDLSNVRSVSEFMFGNGGIDYSLVFIHNDGTVSELSIRNDYSGIDLKLYKSVSGYSDIISIVEDSSDDGVGAKVYNKNGEGIEYTSPRYK